MRLIIVADEWVYHYLKNQSGPALEEKAFAFLKCVRKRGDRLIVVNGSAFAKKVFALAKENRQPFKQYSTLFLGIITSDDAILLSEADLKPFPQELSIVKEDDRYLIRAQLTVPESFILTSDGVLINDLKSYPEIKLENVDTFLDGYLEECARIS